MTTENIADISREIDNDKEPEQIEVEVDKETGKLVEFHRETDASMQAGHAKIA